MSSHHGQAETFLNNLVAQVRLDPSLATFAPLPDAAPSPISPPTPNLFYHLEQRAIQEARGLGHPLVSHPEESYTPQPSSLSRDAVWVTHLDTPAEISASLALAWPWAQLSPPQAAPPHDLVLVYPASSRTYPLEENFAREFASVYDMSQFGSFSKLSVVPYTVSTDASATASSAAQVCAIHGASGSLFLLVWPFPLPSCSLALAQCPQLKLLVIPQQVLTAPSQGMLLGLCVAAHASLSRNKGPLVLPSPRSDVCFACVMPASSHWLAAACCDAAGSELHCKVFAASSGLDAAAAWAQECTQGGLLCLVTSLAPPPTSTPDFCSCHPSNLSQWTPHGRAAVPPNLSDLLDDLALLATASEQPARSLACINLGAYSKPSSHIGWHLPLFMRACSLLACYVKLAKD